MLERGEAAPLFCLVLLSMPTPTPMPPPPPTAKPRNGRLRRGIYLLPSAFTIGNMLLGFYAVVSATRGEFQKGALLVFAAAILDALDGRIARMSGTDSDFGKEYDSLADVPLAKLWGWHRAMRRTASQLPRSAPCLARACSAYAEQVGANRHCPGMYGEITAL